MPNKPITIRSWLSFFSHVITWTLEIHGDTLIHMYFGEIETENPAVYIIFRNELAFPSCIYSSNDRALGDKKMNESFPPPEFMCVTNLIFNTHKGTNTCAQIQSDGNFNYARNPDVSHVNGRSSLARTRLMRVKIILIKTLSGIFRSADSNSLANLSHHASFLKVSADFFGGRRVVDLRLPEVGYIPLVPVHEVTKGVCVADDLPKRRFSYGMKSVVREHATGTAYQRSGTKIK